MLMSDVLPAATRRVVSAIAPEPTPIQQEMAAFAQEEDFPIIGPEAGGFLRVIARLVDATDIFEFGSGFGYSATWFAEALPADGRIILTEIDADEISLAQEYLNRAGYAARSVIEHGNALEIVNDYAGPFDVVLIDIAKAQYLDAFEAARKRLAPGGVMIADNVVSGPSTPDEIAAGLEGTIEPDNDSLCGIVTYLEHVQADSKFDTSILPIGNGLAVSVDRE